MTQGMHKILYGDQGTLTKEKASPEDGWQGICNLPRGGMKEEKQQISEKDQGTLVEGYISTEDEWKGRCNLPREWMSQEKQETTKINQGTPTQGNVSPEDSCKVPYEWSWQEEQQTLDKERSDLEEMKAKLTLHQKSIDEEEQITEEIFKSLKILHIQLKCSLVHV